MPGRTHQRHAVDDGPQAPAVLVAHVVQDLPRQRIQRKRQRERESIFLPRKGADVAEWRHPVQGGMVQLWRGRHGRPGGWPQLRRCCSCCKALEELSGYVR